MQVYELDLGVIVAATFSSSALTVSGVGSSKLRVAIYLFS